MLYVQHAQMIFVYVKDVKPESPKHVKHKYQLTDEKAKDIMRIACCWHSMEQDTMIRCGALIYASPFGFRTHNISFGCRNLRRRHCAKTQGVTIIEAPRSLRSLRHCSTRGRQRKTKGPCVVQVWACDKAHDVSPLLGPIRIQH